MKKYMYVSVVLMLCLVIPGVGFSQNGQKAPASKGPQGYEAFFKPGMKKMEGALTVYQADDKCFLEIPAGLLGRDLLFYGQVVNGNGGSGLFTKSLGVASFAMESEHRVSLSKGILSERVADTASFMYPLLKERMLHPIDMLYPVVAYGADRKSPIIDITSIVKSGTEWFGSADRGKVNANYSSILDAGNLKDGVRVNVCRYHDFSKPSLPGLGAGQEGMVSVEMACVIRVLPEEKMCVRYADPRVGYNTLSYLDYGVDPRGIKNVTIINKWNVTIDAKDEATARRFEAVEAVNPIVFYVAPNVPVAFREAIRKGIMQWDAAFLTAGLKNAIQVKEADESMDLTSVDALVTYSVNGGGVTNSILTDPLTGEILAARVNVAYGFASGLLSDYWAACGDVDERSMKDMYSGDIAKDMLQSMVAENVGYVLGLKRNMAGSRAFTVEQVRDRDWVKKNGFTASVMDGCLFNYAVQPEDGMVPEDLFARVGAYDHWAIHWGYRQFSANPLPEKDSKTLKQLVASVAKSKLLRYVEENRNNFLTQPNDLSSDVVKACELGMKSLERIYPRIEAYSAGLNDENLDVMKRLYSEVSSTYGRYLRSVYKLIGGCSVLPVVKGMSESPVSFASREEQQQAMKFLERYLFSGGAAWYDSKVSQRNNWGTHEETLLLLSGTLLKEMLQPECVGNLLKAEMALGGKAYRVQDLFADLDRCLFANFSAASVSSNVKKGMQAAYVNCLAECVQMNGTATTDYSVVVVGQLQKIKDRLTVLSKSHANELERMQYRNLLFKIDRKLKTPAPVSLKDLGK